MNPPLMNVNESFWEKYSLAEIMEIIGGGTPKTTNPDYWNGDIPWLSVKDFNNDLRYVYETEKTITQIGLENSSTNILNKDDIIISARGTVGELAMIPFPMAFNQSCYGIRAKGNLVDQIYLYYLLKDCIQDLKQNTHGSVFDTITRDTFASIEISLPPLATQKKIAAILSSLDDKIEINTRMNKVLEEIARALFHRWFVEFEFPNDEGKPYKSSGGRMIASEMGEIPGGWKIISFHDILIPRVEKSNDPTIPEYSVTNGGIQPRDEKFKKKLSASTSKNKIIHRYDLVFGMSRETLNWGLMKEDIGGVSSAYNVFLVDKQINPFYLESFILQHPSYFKDIIKPAAREGQGIDKAALFEKYLYIPSPELLEQYYQIEKRITLMQEHLEDETDLLAQTRDSLLPKLMSNEVIVLMNMGGEKIW